MGDSEVVIPGFKDAQTLSEHVLQSMMEAVKASSGIPNAGGDYEYYSTFRGFRALIQKEKSIISSLMKNFIPGQKARDQFELCDVEDKFDIILDMNASILENVGCQLDEATNSKKTSDDDFLLSTKTVLPINTSWNKTPNKTSKELQSYTLLCAKNIQRPQVTFKDKIDNSNSPFVPLIKEKPNATKPLAILIEKEDSGEKFSHPYEWEIEHFKPSEEQLRRCEPKLPLPVSETPFVLVETKEELEALISDLRMQREIAVDVENHSYRSFQGFTCLIQISTRTKDFVIDAIKLRSELALLNEVFTDPKIVKVLHGADMDVLWLQRDFGVYFVNLFDTGQASRVLNFAHLSLAYLLKHYCHIEVDKQFQLADWRIRPLPAPLIKYAREDTHFLLYVYDCIKNDLLEKGDINQSLLMSVLQRSKDICLKRYEKHLFDNKKYLDVYRKSRKLFGARQLFCLKELYAWRDKVARVEDESYGYVLPNHMLLRIAETMPKEPEGILACCNPVPPLVSQQLHELHLIVTKANNCPLNILESSEPEKILKVHKPVDISNMLHSLHDVHHSKYQKMNKFTLPGSNSSRDIYNFNSVEVPLKKELSLPLFDAAIQEDNYPTHCDMAEDVAKSIDEDNKSPYERYVITKEYRETSREEETAATSQVTDQEASLKRFIETVKMSSNNCSSNTLSPSTPVASGSRVPEAEDVSTNDTPSAKKKKKRKKNSRPPPDMPLEKTQTKKTKLTNAPSFKPFDYSQTDSSMLKGKQKSNKSVFTPHDTPVQNKKAGKKGWRRKGFGKQATFNTQAGGSNQRNRTKN